jgi:hypothetical protein
LAFITRRKGFQKLFENAFEILEKEKKMKMSFLLNFWPEGLLLPPPLHLAQSASSTGRLTSRLPLSRREPRNGPAQLKPQARLAVTPGFLKNKIRLTYVCPGSPHICQNEKVSETILLYNVYIAILTLTLEYCGTVTKLHAPFFSGMADWWLRMPNTSERLLETPLPLYPSSE